MISFSMLGDSGRLGNQLFRIAATVALASAHGDRYVFPPWEYEGVFNLHGCFSDCITWDCVWQEPAFHYQPIVYRPNMDLRGFFQSERYFGHCRNLIRSLLSPAICIPTQRGVCGVHVRRGDYLSERALHPPLSLSYYRRAMTLFPESSFLVFSDDIDWCRFVFRGRRFAFAPGNPDYVDLALMASCQDNIIANSSFSWWAAWLNDNPDKRIVAPLPTRWFGRRLDMHDTRDLVPREWMVV
jgi:hypothetical protein